MSRGRCITRSARPPTPKDLLEDLIHELKELVALDPQVRDTTLLIAPDCLHDFLDFNDFLAEADRALVDLELDGVLQIASLHPQLPVCRHRMRMTSPISPTARPTPRCTCCAKTALTARWRPSRMPKSIFEVNMQTMERLGAEGWAALNVGAHGS